MLSTISSYVWGGGEEIRENAKDVDEDWILVDKEPPSMFASSVAHQVSPHQDLLSHALTTLVAHKKEATGEHLPSAVVHLAAAKSPDGVTASLSHQTPTALSDIRSSSLAHQTPKTVTDTHCSSISYQTSTAQTDILISSLAHQTPLPVTLHPSPAASFSLKPCVDIASKGLCYKEPPKICYQEPPKICYQEPPKLCYTAPATICFTAPATICYQAPLSICYASSSSEPIKFIPRKSATSASFKTSQVSLSTFYSETSRATNYKPRMEASSPAFQTGEVPNVTFFCQEHKMRKETKNMETLSDSDISTAAHLVGFHQLETNFNDLLDVKDGDKTAKRKREVSTEVEERRKVQLTWPNPCRRMMMMKKRPLSRRSLVKLNQRKVFAMSGTK